MPASVRLFLFALACSLFVAPPEVYGQQADTTQLPEIAPQEIEIRGERQIALPSLQRQPLTGFAAPPEVPQVPPDHRPYVKPYEQELDDLPESLPLPETVSSPLQPPSSPARGFVQGGGGRYVGRFLEGRARVPLTTTEHLSVHGAYTGLEEDPDSDVADARVRFESRRDAVQILADAHGSAQRYALFGAIPQTGASSIPDRESHSVGAALHLQSLGPAPASATVKFDRMVFSSFEDTNGGSDSTVRENQLTLEGSVNIPTTFRPQLDAAYSQSWFGEDASSETAFSFDGGGTLSFLSSDSTSVEVGARVLAFDAPVRLTGASPPLVDDLFVVPYLDAEWRVTRTVTLHLQNRPHLTRSSLNRLYAENPYAVPAPSLRPTVETTNAEVGLTLGLGPVRVGAKGGYRYATTYQSFVPRFSDSSPDLFGVRYDAARIFQGRGQIALQGIEGVQASLGVSVRDGVLAGTDRTLPNFATIAADALLTVSFAGGDGFFKAQSHLEGSRYATAAETIRLDPYFFLDLEATYALTENIEILGRAENIAFEAPVKWVQYPRPPAQISAGLRIRW